jgi:hypothetical protein
MQSVKHKSLAFAIAVLLIASIGASTALIPNTSAHSPAWNIPTFAYVAAEPSVVGVGQTALIDMFLGNAPIPSSAIPNTYRYHNYQLIITAPNGTSTTQNFATISDTTDNQVAYLTPDVVGTWNITFNYLGQTLSSNVTDQPAGSVWLGDTYLPSSYSATLTVTQNPVPLSPVPISYSPTAYWTRPIFGENSYWYPYASNWLGTGSPVSSLVGSGTISGFGTNSFAEREPGDAVGSPTGHVMWTNPIEVGGIVGDNQSYITGNSYFEGSAYNQRFTNPIIVGGLLIYNPPISFAGSNSGPTTALQLSTGKILWQSTYLPNSDPIASGPPNNVPAISFAYVYDVQDPNQHGTYPPVLFTSSFGEAFNAYTGNWLFNVTGVPSGSIAQGPQGEQLRYVFAQGGNATNPSWTLAEWNSSKLWTYTGLSPAADTSSVSPVTGSNNWSYNYYYTPTFSNVSSTSYVNNVPTTTITNYTAITSAVNASVWQTIDPTAITASNPTPANPHIRYDWNISVPWLNVMGNQTVTTISNATGEYYVKGYNLAANSAGVITGTYNPDYSYTYSSTTYSNPASASMPFSVMYTLYNNMLICRNGSLPALGGAQTQYTYFAIDLNPSHSTLGQILWMQSYSPPANNITVSQGPIDPTAGVFTEGYKETTQWVGYSMATGARVWGPTAGQAPLDYFGNPIYPYVTGMCAYGNLYSCGQAGVVYCYSMTNGNLLWTYGNGNGAGNTTESYFQRPGNFPIEINAIGNGVLYMIVTEHTIETPILKGSTAFAINATDGTLLWQIADYTGEFGSMSYAIADGQSVFYNGYDDSIYDLGQGPTATTVAAGPEVTALGSNVVIQGTVMDVSVGTQQTQVKGNFPNGVPACSSGTMTAWMGYVYQQQPIPTNFTGVPVQLYVLDANGNYRPIGTATTTSSGTYSYVWKPDIPGSYTIYANFAGDQDYWPSNAQSTFNVMSSTSTAPTPTVTTVTQSLADTYFVPVSAVIIVLLIVVAALAILALRKRP